MPRLSRFTGHIFGKKATGQFDSAGNIKRRQRFRRFLVESLEDRRMLATVVWNGEGNTTNWSEHANWVGNVAPVTNDNLVFPTGVASVTSVNDLTGQTFGSILIAGANYDLSGEPIILDGSITVEGDGNSIGIDLTLAVAAGIANNGGGTFSIDGAIALNGHSLSVSNSAGGAVELNDTLSGVGDVSFSGNGTIALAVANSYTGETLVSGGTLVVQDGGSLGTGDGTAATGTRVINGAYLQLENSITIEDELLTSDEARVISDGDNVWTGDMTDVGSDYLYLWPNSGSSLQVDGNVTPYYLDVRNGEVILNDTANSATYTYIQSNGSLDVNGNHNSAITYAYGDLTVDGSYTNSNWMYVYSDFVVNGTFTNNYYTQIQSGGTAVINGASTSSYTRIYSGSKLEVNASYTNTYDAYVYSGGTLLANGTYESGYSTYVQGGTVTGSGTATAGTSNSAYQMRVQSGGTVRPGTSPGILAVGDYLVENSSGNLNVELNGTTAGSGYDQLQVTGCQVSTYLAA